MTASALVVALVTLVMVLGTAWVVGQAMLAYWIVRASPPRPVAVAVCWRWDSWVATDAPQQPGLCVVHDVGPVRVFVLYGAPSE